MPDAPPPLPPQPPQDGQPAYVPYAQPYPQVYAAPASPLAITSLVLGCVSYVMFGPLASIPAVICGHLALRRIRNSGGTIGGRGMAVGGLAAGYVNIALAALILSLVVPALFKARSAAMRVACMSNLRQIGTACLMYSSDNKGELPPDLDVLISEKYLASPRPLAGGPSVFVCPEAGDKTVPSYELCVTGKMSRYPNPGRTVLLREKHAHHDGRRCCVYLDGTTGTIGAGAPLPPPVPGGGDLTGR